MCHQPGDRPHLGSVGGASSDEGPMVLRSSDGTRFDAFAARAASPSGTGMIVLPDSGGLSEFYKELARRFAGEGFDAVAIDYYGRTAGLGARPARFNGDDHAAKTSPETVDADVAAAAEYLRSREGGAVQRIFSVGFCFGGAASWRQAARGLDGAIGFYGSGAMLRAAVPDLRTLRAPLLLLVAEADPYFPIDDSKQIDRELEAAGVPHRTVIYERAPHSFFSSPDWAAVNDDAWRQVLDFVRHPAAA